MATRAKYTRAKGNEQNNETKLDTDILMRFSPTYGNPLFTQASMSPVPWPSSSENQRALLQSKLLKNLWTKLYGLLRLSEEKLKDSIWLSMFQKEKLLMYGNPEKKDSSP